MGLNWLPAQAGNGVRVFAPPRAWVLRSGAPPRRSGAEKKVIQDVAGPGVGGGYPTPGRMVGTGGAAQRHGPAPNWRLPWVYRTSPSGKGRILTSA